MLAHSESIDHEELISLLKYIEKRKFIKTQKRPNENLKTFRQPSTYFIGEFRIKFLLLTVKGRIELEKIQKQTDSSQGFIAMWFHSSMNDVLEQAFKPGIEYAGYKAKRIDQEEHVNKIDDMIIAEIRRSRFVVADFTGERTGVYYEAGFAHGLDIPVIFTCHESYFELHFDIRQYNCITWGQKNEERKAQLRNARNADDFNKLNKLRREWLAEDVKDTDILYGLKKDLVNRISAVLRDGPHKKPETTSDKARP